MNFEKIIISSNINNKIINILKILIICFVGSSMILFFDPFYERTEDSYLYGVFAIRTIDEGYTFSHELIQNNEYRGFIPSQGFRTIQGDAVPSVLGMPLISSAVYSVFGLYGLFYFGPIATIILLIISERITTKLFSKTMGLIVLSFLATSELLLYVGRVLLTDNFFTIFFILGIFYLVMFYRNKKEKHILFASIFFAFSIFIRMNGMISLPLELVVIGLVFVNQKRTTSSFLIWKKSNCKFEDIKKYSKFVMKIFIPWIVIFMIIFSYNAYFFGNPLESSTKDDDYYKSIDKGFLKSLSNTEPKVRFDNILSYTNSILPSPVNRLQYFTENFDDRLDEHYPFISSIFKPILLNDSFSKINFGFISLGILGMGILLSIKTRKNYFEVILYSLFIFSFLFIFSKEFVVDRYMLPLLPLFFTIVGYLIIRPFNLEPTKYVKLIFVSKTLVIIFTCIFFVFAFYLSEPIQILKIEGLEITNPNEKASRYPLDKEGISKNSIVFGILSTKTLDYGLIPFNPFIGHPWKSNFDENMVSSETIDVINYYMKNGYNFYSFKEPQSHLDKPFLRHLVENYDFVVKDYSPNFCKVEIDNDDSEKSDESCF